MSETPEPTHQRVVDCTREGLVLGALSHGTTAEWALSNAKAWLEWLDASPDAAERSCREAFALAAVECFGTARFDGAQAVKLAECAAFCIVTAPVA